MVDRKYLALIQTEIDGELDDHQRAELSRRLLADPSARLLRDQMRRLCQALDGVESAEPPPQLRSDILAALPQMRARRVKSVGRRRDGALPRYWPAYC